MKKISSIVHYIKVSPFRGRFRGGFSILLLLMSAPLQAQTILGEVYGGGHNGKVSGATSVYVSAGTIGNDSLVGTPYGGVFGAGEGDSAIVAGNTQVTIAGGTFLNSIYGGGKRANLMGNTNVEIYGGTVHVNVYGGARMADVKGYAYVYVHDISGKTKVSPVLGNVYGGNDIAGEIMNDNGSGVRTAPDFYNSIAATAKPSVIPTTFVRIGQDVVATQPYIGNIYGGCDGSYSYQPATTGYNITMLKNRYKTDREVINVAKKPTMDRSYIEFNGGTVGNIFAGGDNVTITDAADIHLASPISSTLASATIPKHYILKECTTKEDSTKYGFLDEFQTGEYTVNGDNATFTYEINRCFGGNNKAAMDIRPYWHLEAANINNLYSGGNKGEMTSATGVIVSVEGDAMKVQNVFGGGRLASIHPSSATIPAETIDGFDFPKDFAARVLIKGGEVHNVYGGNDVSGQVYLGAYVAIRSSIVNNVYGSGNGSYAYYSSNKYDESDYFYQTNGLTGQAAINALNTHRPNTAYAVVDLAGTASDTTFIGGSVFCGGNCASLRDLTGDLETAQAKIKMGSYVITNNVFLGSNGEKMLDEDVIMLMNDNSRNPDIDLTNHEQMEEYMSGVEVKIKPTIEFASDYVPYSTKIGSFFCGGNKGSMSAAGTFDIGFLKKIVIFDKLVAGSNDANVTYKNDSKKEDGTTSSLVNHSYVLGGLTTHTETKVKLDVTEIKLEPRKITYNESTRKFTFGWNHYQGDEATEGDMSDYVGYLHGGNIYGGCYSSGYVNGDVQINISENVTTSDFYNHIQKESVVIGGKTYNYDWDDHLFEPFVSLLTCYGGGYGTETEIWGNTTINITDSAHIMKARGGGELGWIGKLKRDDITGNIIASTDSFKSYYWNDSTKFFKIAKYEVEQAYDATVHLNANLIYTDVNGEKKITNNVAEMCAGGFKGTVTGSTHAIVDNGCVYTVFGGASNANIYGSAETLIGKNGFPYVSQTVYGGNDFGGQIMGAKVYETKNNAEGSIQKVKCNTYVEYFSGEIGYNTGELYTPDSVSADFGIFGGSYGEYDYRSSRASGNIKYMGKDGKPKATSQPNLLGKVIIEGNEADLASNTFVNISSKTTKNEDKIGRVYGGGQGLKGQNGVANTRQTYVLLNAANANARPNFLMQYAFGAGDCTTTWYSRLDAYSGNAHHLFGANRGVSYGQSISELSKKETLAKAEGYGVANLGSTAGEIQSLSYMGEVSVMNLYPTMIAPQMEVYASGAYSGTKETYLNLYGGTVAEVYGSSFNEGVTYLTQVNVPEGSTLKCNAIYGGGRGDSTLYPCDTYLSTIKYNSADARVENGIYGGNRDCRFTRRTMIQINVPVINTLGELVNVYGGGQGKNTISEITYVSLDDGAKVKNVYGGGDEGLVYNKPAVINYMLTKDYYKDKYLIGSSTESGGTRDGSNSYCLGDCEIGGFNTWKKNPLVKDRILFPNSGYEMTIDSLVETRMDYAKEQYEYNTDVQIRKGAVVTENVYGGGYGSLAYSAGCAGVHLLGGTVMGNIYGGGYGGTIIDEPQIAGTILKDVYGNTVVGPMVMNTETRIHLDGGTCTNSFGSGLNGNVYGNTYTFIGTDTCGTGKTTTFYDGDPTVTRSLYAGGENGAVYTATDYSSTTTPKADIEGSGTANIYMYNGHIGYTYDTEATEDSLKYLTNVDFKDPTDSILYNNGNVFGGGYGEDAKTMYSNVIMTGGIVRNSLYGGGEIAAIGIGTVTKSTDSQTATIEKAGKTHIEMYGGHVLRDVFGGGRGYSYDLKGDEVVGTKFYSDGYVFGKTDVNIYRGEIGTADTKSIEDGYGNVFGGGNVGFVYSNEGAKWTAASDATHTQGWYYKKNGSSWTDELSEDCRVVISPYTRVNANDSVEVNGTKYASCTYVPTDQLNYLYKKNNDLQNIDPQKTADSLKWEKMDYLTGITIHNAIFAGGNVTRGDSKLYADTKTVYGNATATINDIYYRDMVTVGTENVGGIYGDGNLTKVDGFREICVANYGTDYYGLEEEIDTVSYFKLNDRERSYFQLMYKCQHSYSKYVEGQTISIDVYKLLPEAEKGNWKMAGFCSVYAGRLLNTIQRADFVGIHGSRIVLQGAQDRTVSVVDYMEYAINRVGELSLNQIESKLDDNEDEKTHGNYFGFYNTVNYLEALTSDVDFNSKRLTSSTSRPEDGKTYKEYKKDNMNDSWVNNGTSMNKIALLSGVSLELTTQESTDSNKVYGPITGVVELDLIDLGKNIGGAFVYAKNIHGVRSGTMNEHAYISEYNKGAVTHSGYTYSDTEEYEGLETSGNFVHPAKPIVDECYPETHNANAPAHYWYLRGSIYIYDQYISAYTGASTAYKADVQIPLTITAGTHGRLKILNIQPNLYAYYQKDGTTPLGKNGKVIVEAKTYNNNDVVTYWDWSQMTDDDKKVFVHDTYIALQAFTYLPSGASDSVSVEKNTVMLSSDFAKLPDEVTVNGVKTTKDKAVHISNATSHDTGYALTADITNPADWDDRYVHNTDPNNIITKAVYNKLSAEEKKNYFVGPSYHTTTGIYGQTDYNVGDIISNEIHDAYTKIGSTSGLPTQATVEETYITTGTITYTYQGVEKRLVAGVGISKTEYTEAIKVSGNQDKLQEAYVCNSTVQLGENYIITGELVSKTRYDALDAKTKTSFSKAWLCTAAGKYGGTRYEGNQNYDALKGWCDLTAADRDKFIFNYDALDLFIKNLDPSATIADYDKDPTVHYYNKQIELDYKARCHTEFTYTNSAGTSRSIAKGDTLTRIDFEGLPNEKIHYARVKASSGVDYYIANKDFTYGDWPYAAGDSISPLTYVEMSAGMKTNVTVLNFPTGGVYYYCKQKYMVNENGEGVDVTNVHGASATYTTNDSVPVGVVITENNFKNLSNRQTNLTVIGTSPVETSTLYVARDANMQDVMKDRVITLIYQYQYDESTTDGQMSTVTERHVVNIHLLFRSGSPSIGQLRVPGAVLPGTTVGLKQPSVTKGAYEILGGGWEIYTNQTDADNHINGQPYYNNKTLLYFYQTGQYINYYAKTYMGKTYSNSVPLEVANYHSINDVIADTEHHMYIDRPEVPRNCKVYIDNDVSKSDPTKNELDLLKDLFDLTTTGLSGHGSTNEYIKGCQNLDFVLQDDVTPKANTTWEPLGTATQCFGNNGYFHGDGHAIIGLNNSLFGYYCGKIYNLGMKGSFAGAGIAKNEGEYAANCWVWNEDTTSTTGHVGNPIFGNGDASKLYNCYYYEEKDATNKYSSIPEKVIRKDETAFNNGEVAYDLNKYYLVKRYNDNLETPLTTNPYSYWTIKDDNSLELHQNAGGYLDEDALITVTEEGEPDRKMSYVEYRYWDGDFVNADGQLHTVADERFYDNEYYPIYPDDYIFFGQLLNYGYVGGKTHATYPHSIVKMDNNRILLGNNTSNRVFRAPAYYGSTTKQVTHFNVECVMPTQYNKPLSSTTTTEVLTPAEHGITIIMNGTNIETSTETLENGNIQTTKKTTVDNMNEQTRTITTEVTIAKPTDVYPNMTAIDFTGYNDYPYYKGTSNDIFFTPILDYKTLVGFSNPDQSRNMLVYANSEEDADGYSILDNYLFEPNLVFTNSTYKNIPKITSAASSAVQGHLVDKDGENYVTDRNHFLVDENDYHCPIPFNMGEGKRMWYQRTPCTYNTTGSNGYESIVLPFTATLVSAHQKGEITHFYNNDKNNHEYWLRGFQGVDGTTLKFIRPMKSSLTDAGYDERYETTSQYEVNNDFLYDYYYGYSSGHDDNQDVYQKYYNSTRTYASYVNLTANVPYLVAFPGERYYEFDMSGKFVPSNTLSSINKLDLQTISFCSAEGAYIPVLPETGALETTHDGYTFRGVFQKKDMTLITDSFRIINSNGDKFDKRSNVYTNLEDHTLKYMQPFHAYLVIPTPVPAKSDFSISEDASYIGSSVTKSSGLTVTTGPKVIYITNNSDEDIDVNVYNASGKQIGSTTLGAGSSIDVPVGISGIYMVNTQKVLVK